MTSCHSRERVVGCMRLPGGEMGGEGACLDIGTVL